MQYGQSFNEFVIFEASMCFSIYFQAVANSVPGWIYGSILCYVLHYVNIQTMAVSIFTMCSLALMRFAGLILPYQFRDSCVSTSRRFAGAAIVVVVWVLGSIIALPNLAYFKYSINNDSGLNFKLFYRKHGVLT